MYDFYYQSLLNNDSKFSPRSGTRYLEMWDHDDGTGVHCDEGELRETEISPWLHKALPETIHAPEASGRLSTARLRLLIGSPEQHESDAQILPLPFSKETFEQIRSAWTLPSEFLRMMLSTLPIRTSYSFNSPCGKPERVVMMFRGGRSRDWNYCLALIHDILAGTTCAMVQGLEKHEITLLIHCLKESREHVGKPMLLPLFLTELKTHFFSVLLEQRALSLEAIEYETGMAHGFSEDPKRNPALQASRQEDLQKLNFQPITQKLTGLTGTLAFCNLTFAACRQDLDLIIVTSRKCTVSGEPRRKASIMDETRPDADQRANYVKGLLDGAQAHQAVLLERTKAQVQTVYSMIGQRDNQLNVKTARLALRDSHDMRVIAAVTFIFLPGTFTATFFSTSFFDFRGSNHTVSWWVWLFFVVTVGLMIIVGAGWYRVKRKQNSAISKSLDVDLETGVISTAQAELELLMASGKGALSPSSTAPPSTIARRPTSIGRIAETGEYTRNDMKTRLWMNDIPLTWNTHN